MGAPGSSRAFSTPERVPPPPLRRVSDSKQGPPASSAPPLDAIDVRRGAPRGRKGRHFYLRPVRPPRTDRIPRPDHRACPKSTPAPRDLDAGRPPGRAGAMSSLFGKTFDNLKHKAHSAAKQVYEAVTPVKVRGPLSPAPKPGGPPPPPAPPPPRPPPRTPHPPRRRPTRSSRTGRSPQTSSSRPGISSPAPARRGRGSRATPPDASPTCPPTASTW